MYAVLDDNFFLIKYFDELKASYSETCGLNFFLQIHKGLKKYKSEHLVKYLANFLKSYLA